ncbi:hypothetical protein B0H66DRAFT_549871 [Apodospora peruviana]|uniref:NmrA-like domain-containing protein n=1 Tax=Apodospora peruviana TaxID=516989 RepID=A0AAE0MBU8_9PEZI|nr:hypothetical protein B0H66DRAFT_549871 [Apodospora peruviana]
MAQYVKDQPAGFTNRIERVAIVGAAGNVGKPITEALLATGKHELTALTRKGSPNSLPAGVKVATIDYGDEQSIVDALKGQQFLIISMSVTAPPESHHKLVVAAAKAGVPYVMPNCYGRLIQDNDALSKETLIGESYLAGVRDIEAQGVSKWIAMSCSFWYEYSLAGGLDYYGFDFATKKAIFYDDGLVKINTTTHLQCGRAMAALLSLKELPENENDTDVTLSQWANKPLTIRSFLASQRDMLDSVHRVMGTTDADWTIEHESAVERYQNGVKLMMSGAPDARRGFGRALYSRPFFPNAGFRWDVGLANQDLGLPEEDLDEATKRAVDMALNEEYIKKRALYGKKE